jgi:DNA modification methylase
MENRNLKIVYVPINELKPSEYNPRKWNDKIIADIKNSITKFGVVDPLIVNSADNRKNVVIGGHLRLHTCKELGFKEMPVVYVNIADIKKEQELNVRLNKNQGEFDFELLANIDVEILEDIGFESIELDKIFQLESKPEDDEVPEIKKTDIKTGDIFQLGEHRLFCGDCTIKENVDRLMQGERADMVFTDPPYGVGFRYNSKEVSLNDTLEYEDYKKFCFLWLNNIKAISDFIVITTGHKNKKLYYEYDNNINELVWIKKNGQSHGYISYLLATEPIVCYGKLPNKRRYNHDYFEFTIHSHKELEGEHPCPKPVELIIAIIEPATDRGMSVLDIFGGSGTTLIACEKLNRKCRMMEIDAVYCQVIIDRWEQFTGKKAKQIDS